MSHHKLREEKNCLNCGETVEERFCPKCGQENTINRPSFHYLFSHFAEDLVHYDGAFWKTLKNLLFRPGKIIKEYLDGKRKTYVPPVKLYIFVSFIAFFIPFILPDFDEDPKEVTTYEKEALAGAQKQVGEAFKGIEVAGVSNIRTVEQLDSIQNSLPAGQKIPQDQYDIYKNSLGFINSNLLNPETGEVDLDLDNPRTYFLRHTKDGISIDNYGKVKTVADFDSIHASVPEEKRFGFLEKKIYRKMIEIRERSVDRNENLMEAFIEKFVHNMPKALFVYLPIFAFSLWLFHGKKKWLYYDHGVFTLYYFSLLLILITTNIFVSWLLFLLVYWFPGISGLVDLMVGLMITASLLYLFFYFFRSHSRVYGENKAISRIKSFSVFWLNLVLFTIILSFYTLVTFLNM